MSQSAVTVKVTGRVQRVAFRAWAQSRARSLNLTGWIRNDPTGSVSLCLQGDATAVETMLAELWSGPACASVRDVQSTGCAPDASLSGFEIRR